MSESESEFPMRLHRFMALCGVASRRKAEELILDGRVSVNDSVVSELGVKVSEGDKVAVDGRVIQLARKITLVMNKPAGYTTTLSDPHASQTVAQLLPDMGVPVKPVGRLDNQTTGLLLFTSDGDLAFRLTHPRYGVTKRYKVKVNGNVPIPKLERLERGVVMDGKRTAPCEIKPLHATGQGDAVYEVILKEGRNRQIRRMFEIVGFRVLELTRTDYGFLKLKGLGPGQCRVLTQSEVQRLRDLVGIDEGHGKKINTKSARSKKNARPGPAPARKSD